MLSKGGKGLLTLAEAGERCRCRNCGRKDALVIPSRESFETR